MGTSFSFHIQKISLSKKPRSDPSGHPRKDGRRHKLFVHGKIQYKCTLCEYFTPDKKLLEELKQAVHEGVKYPCKICEYKASSKSCLYTHIQNKHKGKKYL